MKHVVQYIGNISNWFYSLKLFKTVFNVTESREVGEESSKPENSPTSPEERTEDDLQKEDVENVVVDSPAEVPVVDSPAEVPVTDKDPEVPTAHKDPEVPTTSSTKKSLKVSVYQYIDIHLGWALIDIYILVRKNLKLLHIY